MLFQGFLACFSKQEITNKYYLYANNDFTICHQQTETNVLTQKVSERFRLGRISKHTRWSFCMPPIKDVTHH